MAHKRNFNDKEFAWSASWQGQQSEKSIALLKALHIVTRDGEMNADSRRKMKQVLHLTNLLRPTIETLLENSDNPSLLTWARGNLTWALSFMTWSSVPRVAEALSAWKNEPILSINHARWQWNPGSNA